MNCLKLKVSFYKVFNPLSANKQRPRICTYSFEELRLRLSCLRWDSRGRRPKKGFPFALTFFQPLQLGPEVLCLLAVDLLGGFIF